MYITRSGTATMSFITKDEKIEFTDFAYVDYFFWICPASRKVFASPFLSISDSTAQNMTDMVYKCYEYHIYRYSRPHLIFPFNRRQIMTTYFKVSLASLRKERKKEIACGVVGYLYDNGFLKVLFQHWNQVWQVILAVQIEWMRLWTEKGGIRTHPTYILNWRKVGHIDYHRSLHLQSFLVIKVWLSLLFQGCFSSFSTIIEHSYYIKRC